MRRFSLLALALAAASLTATAAEARHRHHHHHDVYVAQGREIEVKKHRSFLEPGNVVPVGTENRYVGDSTRLNADAPGGAARRDDMHQGLLPSQGELPGNWPR